MKKVVYSISRFSKFGNTKMTGVGFITDKDLIIACVSQKGKFVPFDEVFVSMLILKSKKEPSKERPCSALIVYWRYKI